MFLILRTAGNRPQHKSNIAKKWLDAVENPEFEFAIKANQVFTHAAGTKPAWSSRAMSTQPTRSLIA
jgi:uncharacterized protein YecE (DUF72 family)